MMEEIYFAIRHKASGELMPSAKRDRGYSHWNPSNPEHIFKKAEDSPRLISTRRKAARCIAMWATNPNGKETSHQGYYGEWEADVIFKPDGRTKEDLEIIEVTIKYD